jgi:hypothetical protein
MILRVESRNKAFSADFAGLPESAIPENCLKLSNLGLASTRRTQIARPETASAIGN